jgi:hypothetical protein
MNTHGDSPLDLSIHVFELKKKQAKQEQGASINWGMYASVQDKSENQVKF